MDFYDPILQAEEQKITKMWSKISIYDILQDFVGAEDVAKEMEGN